jgi:isoquinoline 1-oxidoreductase beta subunit
VPLRVRLKTPDQFRLIGSALPRLDVPAKVTGQARFGLDARRPGMLYAVVARPPTWGAKLASADKLDDQRARAVPGVQQVIPIEGGVAVLADSSWAALQGRDALDVQWTGGIAPTLSDADIARTLAERAGKPGAVARVTGDAAAELARSTKKLEATFTLPYLAHVPMEPLNCLAEVNKHQGQEARCEVWAPTQDPDGARATAARVAGVPLAGVTVHTTLLGGGFGRRTVPDEVAEAVELSAKIGRPVQVLWSREDDIRHDRFREASLHRLTGALAAAGMPIAWSHHLVSPSIGGVDSDSGQVDSIATDGATDWPYAIPHARVEWSSVDLPVPVAIWRSVGYSYNTFVVECFLDELAHAGGQDALALRRRLLADAPRLRACLDRAAQRAGWGQPRAGGRALGLAASACFGSFAAQVAEVSLDPGGRPRVHRIWIAADCGLVVNPDIVKAQLEGGIAFGLGAALHGKITIAGGKVAQSNFHDYPQLKLSEMPEVEITLTASAEPPGGVGELAVPAVAPAVANALFALTGKRVRSLPLVGGAG